MRAKKKNVKYLGFLGFMGFLGFDYFTNKNISSLFMFSFFAYFGYFILGKLFQETPDERFVENSVKARFKVFPIPMGALFLLGFCTGYPFATKEFIVITCAVAWAATILAYAILLHHYEKNDGGVY